MYTNICEATTIVFLVVFLVQNFSVAKESRQYFFFSFFKVFVKVYFLSIYTIVRLEVYHQFQSPIKENI